MKFKGKVLIERFTRIIIQKDANEQKNLVEAIVNERQRTVKNIEVVGKKFCLIPRTEKFIGVRFSKIQIQDKLKNRTEQ